MDRIVECVPNFSEGRRREVVAAIADAARAIRDVTVLDVEMDANHNRSVITFVATPEAATEAAFRMAEMAAELIDLNVHRGEHPRIGALDVLPFIPIRGVTMEECVRLARETGQRIAEELQIPVYLYEAAATRPDRKALPNLRKGGYEGLKVEIETNPDRAPDFGPRTLHPTAGATVVGARPPLIAFNVNLGTKDLSVAKRIAKAVREKGGGLPAVRALGFELKDRGLVQVSMNLVDYKTTSIEKAFDAVAELAAKEGGPVVGSEIVGLVPEDALPPDPVKRLRLENFSSSQILENRIVS
ncbi:MAG TPA: glutamate formimidoyltransferase [Thermoplasmata archaeon]|nr:glutamate formimidoyltransferase [Thermoplasmata archaeon]